jgi:hypothetical protein
VYLRSPITFDALSGNAGVGFECDDQSVVNLERCLANGAVRKGVKTVVVNPPMLVDDSVAIGYCTCFHCRCALRFC